MLNEGLLDENGAVYHPFIVRIGENYDPSLEHVSLEGLIKTRGMNDENNSLKASILN